MKSLTNVYFISSSGGAVFIGVLNKIRKGGGDIRLAAMTEEVKNIYHIVNFDELLRSYDKVGRRNKII